SARSPNTPIPTATSTAVTVIGCTRLMRSHGGSSSGKPFGAERAGGAGGACCVGGVCCVGGTGCAGGAGCAGRAGCPGGVCCAGCACFSGGTGFAGSALCVEVIGALLGGTGPPSGSHETWLSVKFTLVLNIEPYPC